VNAEVSSRCLWRFHVYATEGTVPPAFADFETLEGRVEASTSEQRGDDPSANV